MWKALRAGPLTFTAPVGSRHQQYEYSPCGSFEPGDDASLLEQGIENALDVGTLAE